MIIIKRRSAVISLVAAMGLAGCVVDGPTTTDTTDPLMRINFSGDRNISFDTGANALGDQSPTCLTATGPVDVQVIISNSGGIRDASMAAVFSSIDPSSVEVSPVADDISFTFEDEASRDSIIVRMTPPSPGEVRTGVVISFTVTGPYPADITGDARDTSGNQVVLPGFTIRGAGDPVTCFGDN